MPELPRNPQETTHEEPPKNDLLLNWQESDIKINWARGLYDMVDDLMALRGRKKRSMKDDYNEVGLTMQFESYREEGKNKTLKGFSYGTVKHHDQVLHRFCVEMHSGTILLDDAAIGDMGRQDVRNLAYAIKDVMDKEYEHIVDSL